MRISRFAPVLLAAFMMISGPARAEITGVIKAEKVARLTGPEGSDSINPTWEVDLRGTDLGHMANFKGRTYFLFGDSFSTDVTGDGWRWNTLAYTTDTLAADGITFSGWATDADGRARAFIEDKRNNPITNIPTGAIAVGERLYVWYMAMEFWGSKQDPCWRSHFAGLACSDDGTTFQIQQDFQFPMGSNFGMVAAAMGDDDPQLADGYVYIWGTPSNRCGGVKLARVRPEEIARREAWRFFAGTIHDKPLWFLGEEKGKRIVPPRVGEMSVMYNRWAGVWTMMYLTFLEGEDIMRHTGRIVLRQAPKPWGPWSEAIEVVVPRPDLQALYGSYMNPLYVDNDGETVYFTMSLWDPYDVYWWKVKFSKTR